MIFGTDRRAKRTLSSILMRRRVERYTTTLAGLAAPAIVAAMAASILYADAKPNVESSLSLHERVEQLRYAATKVPTEPADVALSANGVRVITLHEPVSDLRVAASDAVEDGS